MPAKVIKQSGVIPYLRKDERYYTVMVSTRGDRNYWIFPKGHIEAGMSAPRSAGLESFEEAGIEGKVEKRAVGAYEYSKFGNAYKVSLYPCKVKKLLKSWPEAGQRRRRVVSFEKAVRMLSDPAMVKLTEKFHDQLLSRTESGDGGD